MKHRSAKFFCWIFLSPLFFAGPSLYAQSLKSAIKLIESEQFEQAGLQLKALIEQTPDNGINYYYSGENILKSYLVDSANVSFREIADSAYQFFKTGSEKDPRNPLNVVGMGRIELLRGNKAGGQQYFDTAIELIGGRKSSSKPGSLAAAFKANVQMKIAEAYIHSSFYDSATTMSLLTDAERYDPKNAELYIVHGDAYLASYDGSNAILQYNKAKELDPKSPKALMRIGNLWYNNKAYLVALNFYQEATTIDSTFAPVYRELGKLYTLARQYDNAAVSYRKFLDLSGSNKSAKIQYAVALISAKQYDLAIILMHEILKDDSTRNDLNRALAYSYYETGQYDHGLAYIREFFRKARPEKVIVSDWVYYGKILSRNKQDSLAVEKFKNAYVLDSNNIDLLNEMAGAYSRLKSFSNAAEIYQKILTRKEPSHVDYYNLARVYFAMKDYTKADTVLAVINTMQPDFIPAYFLRASANVNLDPETKEGKARPYYEAIIERIAGDPGKYTKELITSYEYLGYYYLKAKDYVQSKDYYGKVLTIDPANKNALEALDTLKKYR